MPDGVVQWIDPTSGAAAVVRAGRVYAASSADIEPVARHAGAHVHFDIRRNDGGERAVDIHLRPGTRVSHHQRHFGTLAGARRPDTKGSAPFAHPHPERGRMLAAHPLEVARALVECLQAHALDDALALYTSDALLHADGGDLAGKARIGAWLEKSPLFGVDADPDIKDEEGTVIVSFDSPTGERLELRTRIEHGLIAEQWAGAAPPKGRAREIASGAGPIAVAVLTGGRVEADDVDYALSRIGAIVERIEDPILFARLKLGQSEDPARPRPALAQVALDINGELVRAHVAGRTMREAADLLQRHLADKLDQRAQHRDALRTRAGTGGRAEWRHGDLPTRRPDYFDRPPEERRLVRHKTFAIDELTVDEAAFDMDQLDYDFYLFRDLASGEDALLERTDGNAFRLTRLRPSAVDGGPVSVPLEISRHGAARLGVAEAVARLDATGERFLFFANATSGRGNVVYRRYDGHYGLLTPASLEDTGRA